MGKSASNEDKWRWTLSTAVVFAIVTNPMTYKLVDRIFKTIDVKIANQTGCPTFIGLFIHTIIFILLLRALMEFDI